ncbi:tyrosine-type recombinase/integrase [Kamptonema sp. UHCC 0994]|uniref:tyrosine-type recombinase/integrase n=1 Tax=Kamptonema sp. UHCC 0994 TaxID=3031329 RepID=UPI0023B8900F|nr:tyrosine-type recombinase/integrase [Kamptonema sp. UHCC 0994]MDF0551658.1 tyrosine-type recombinase/integrase [Kamptonema sp. UHCC 0994]
MTQAKQAQPKINVRVYADKGSLALRFSTKYNLIFEQLTGFKGKQKCMGLGMADTPQNCKKAQQIALQIEADLEHSDWVKLFDPTFAKYGIGDAKFAQKMGELIQMPNQKVAMTVGELWEDYLLWKEGQVQPTTFKHNFLGSYTNALKGLKWNNKAQSFTDTGLGIWGLPLNEEIGKMADNSLNKLMCHNTSVKLSSALKEAIDRAMQSGKLQLAKNPFYQLYKEADVSTKDMYAPKQDEHGVWREWWELEDDDEEYSKDVRAFTKSERDAIINAFYEASSDAKRHAATLIEFLFLTGCRHGEAFALRWKDVSFERGYVRFSKSFNKTYKTTQQTKNGTVRMFKLYQPLTELLLRIKPADAKPNDLVFKLMNGSAYGVSNIQGYWNKEKGGGREKGYRSDGTVTSLVREGVLRCYLNPYSTRHTFITLQAQAGVDLVLLAACCGNSVEIIQRHYLGINEKAELVII